LIIVCVERYGPEETRQGYGVLAITTAVPERWWQFPDEITLVNVVVMYLVTVETGSTTGRISLTVPERIISAGTLLVDVSLAHLPVRVT
jgi:hypothetical protein